MHGVPLSPHHILSLWRSHDYFPLGFGYEAYRDIRYDRVLYLIDTGRRWDNGAFNCNDHVDAAALRPPAGQRLSSTADLIALLQQNLLPPLMLISTHPQRWNDDFPAWLHELVFQNLKNRLKSLLSH